MDPEIVQSEVTEDNLMILTPYKNSISIMLRHGTHLVYALHDGTDERGDMDALITLCIMRYNKGGNYETTEETT